MSNALTIKAEHFLFPFANNKFVEPLRLSNPFYLLNFETQLTAREFCENDENYLQLLPYITLRDPDTNKVFMYQRGKKGGEAKLHGNHSIGLGGHIEEAVWPGTTLKEVIIDCIARELQEEVGLKTDGPFSSFYREMLTDTFDKGFYGLYDPTNPVGRVHLGLWMVLDVKPSELGDRELDVINDPRWVSVEELKTLNEDGEIVLENWSILALDTLLMSDRERFLKSIGAYIPPMVVKGAIPIPETVAKEAKCPNACPDCTC